MEFLLAQGYFHFFVFLVILANKSCLLYPESYDFNHLQAHSYWLYNVPWGMYKALMYVKKYYGNPTVILSENGNQQSIEIKEIVVQYLC